MIMYRIPAVLLTMACLILPGISSQAQSAPVDTPADPGAALAQRVDQLSRKLAEQIQTLEEAVKQLQARLGDSFERPSVFNSIERRLEDIEKRLDKLERSVDDLEDQVRRLERDR
ncbi:MAG: hypothetical protein KJ726_04890 [Verrucomicrobia bacterium]|nr:hypothetical protein [Verrucomicrobiota bacterium]MBU1909365.1 hypothetical protein [Verrucomicrobiota bacterium]